MAAKKGSAKKSGASAGGEQRARTPGAPPASDPTLLAGVETAQLATFLAKLGEFRGTLGADEQRMLDALLVTASAAEPGDVQGYGLSGMAVKHLAMAAVVALGIVGGTLGPAGRSAMAAPLEQPTLTGGGMGGGGMGGGTTGGGTTGGGMGGGGTMGPGTTGGTGPGGTMPPGTTGPGGTVRPPQPAQPGQPGQPGIVINVAPGGGHSPGGISIGSGGPSGVTTRGTINNPEAILEAIRQAEAEERARAAELERQTRRAAELEQAAREQQERLRDLELRRRLAELEQQRQEAEARAREVEARALADAEARAREAAQRAAALAAQEAAERAAREAAVQAELRRLQEESARVAQETANRIAQAEAEARRRQQAEEAQHQADLQRQLTQVRQRIEQLRPAVNSDSDLGMEVVSGLTTGSGIGADMEDEYTELLMRESMLQHELGQSQRPQQQPTPAQQPSEPPSQLRDRLNRDLTQ